MKFHPDGTYPEIEEAAQRLGRALTESEVLVLGIGMGQAARALPEALVLIAQERRRQVEKEGWTLAHDDEHIDGELAGAAASYAASAMRQVAEGIPAAAVMPLQTWRWPSKWWKPKDPLRDLVRAGALIVAEIERLRRAAP